MYFVCPSCRTALRVDPAKLPRRPVRYRCKRCGAVSLVQEHLHPRVPSAPAGGARPEPDVDGTVYHHVSDLSQVGVPRASYRMVVEVTDASGGRRELEFSDARITVGRGNVHLRVSDPLVSRLHLEIERVRDRVIVKDLGSTNGTFVNGRTVSAEFVTAGDEIRIGNTILRVRVEIA